MPVLRLETFNVATPALMVPVPIVVAPSLNVTVPLGALPVTLAVKVTAPPALDGLAELDSVVALVTWFTTWFKAVDVLVRLPVSPAYTAVMLWLATLRALVT